MSSEEVAATATTPALAAPAEPTTPAVAAPPSEVPSKPDTAAPPTSKTHPAKPVPKEPVPTAASLLAPKRYIPGAPIPEQPKVKPPKQKKKKPKTKDGQAVLDAHGAALIDTAPGQADIDAGNVADELVADDEEIAQMLKEDEAVEDERTGPSPAIAAVEKKTKNLQDRIARAIKYSEMPEKELNDGQKTLRAALPTLEATLKEMAEVKTAVETYEAKHEATHQEEKKARKEQERARQRQTLKDVFAVAEQKALSKVHVILSFLSLSSALAYTSSSRPFVAAMDESERSAIAKAADILTSEDVAAKEPIIQGLLNERSVEEIDGVAYKRLRSLANSFSQPLSPEPTTVVPEAADLPHVNGNGTAHPEHQPAAIGGGGGGMTFITESELRTPLQFGVVDNDTPLDAVSGVGTNDLSDLDHQPLSSTRDTSIEVIEGASMPSAAAIQQEWVEVEKHDSVPEPVSATADTGAIDWAADDVGDLPSIDTLHAKFGTSGDATPIDSAPATAVMQGLPPNMWAATPPSEHQQSDSSPAPASPAPATEDDGWTPAQNRGAGHRARGSMGGFRGGRGGFEGGGFRVGDRGGPRGGGRGSGFRGGGGGFRGGAGFGGGWQQQQQQQPNGAGDGAAAGDEGAPRPEGGRGGFRGGGGRGRGEWRGDGERRGRGSGFRGRPPPAAAAQTPQ